MRLSRRVIEFLRPLFRKPLKPLTHPVQSFRTLLKLCGYVVKASKSLGAPSVRLLVRGVRLVREEGFEPDEVYDLGLLRKDADPADDRMYVSRARMRTLQEALNPRSWVCLTRQKDLFYRYGEGEGLPVPSLLAVVFPGGVGFSDTGEVLRTPESWEELLVARTSADVVVKPAAGYYGRGIRIYRRAGDHFLDARGSSLSASELVRSTVRGASPDGSVIQERLVNHETLRRLSGTEYLQTVRIITLVDDDSRGRVLSAVLKVIVGHRVTDNYDGGRTGNLFSEISLTDGGLGPAVRTDPRDGRLRTYRDHPSTGVPFRGVRLPHWEETLDLVIRSASSLLPIRTIGWDVGITDGGPRLIEANTWWEAPKPLSTMPELVARLSSAAAAADGMPPRSGTGRA